VVIEIAAHSQALSLCRGQPARVMLNRDDLVSFLDEGCATLSSHPFEIRPPKSPPPARWRMLRCRRPDLGRHHLLSCFGALLLLYFFSPARKSRRAAARWSPLLPSSRRKSRAFTSVTKNPCVMTSISEGRTLGVQSGHDRAKHSRTGGAESYRSLTSTTSSAPSAREGHAQNAENFFLLFCNKKQF
jgi:hypothetical protein